MQLAPNCQRATIRVRPGGPVFLGLFVACGLLSYGASHAPAADEGPARSGLAQQLFARYCSQCHGTDGRGAPGRVNAPTIPDFTNRAWQHSRSNIEMTISILEGRNQQMPANQGMVSDRLARDLVAYVRAFAPAAPRAPVAVVPSPPRPTLTPGGGAASTDKTAPEMSYTPTGDFDTDFDSLLKQFDHLKRQAREVASAPVKGSAPPVGVPPVSVPAADVSPENPPPVAPPPALAGNPPPVAPPSAPPGTPAAAGQDKSRFATVPVSDRPFTPDDVERGRELFLGRRPLANGGAACVGCHTVNRAEARDGGRLGPELTKVYERVGGRTALSTHLWAPATRTMGPAYQRHGLESDEVLALVAYLEDSDRQAVADTSSLPLKPLLLGLGAAVLGLVTVSALGGSRSRRRDRAAPNGKAAPALPPVRADLAPSPADCVGAGL